MEKSPVHLIVEACLPKGIRIIQEDILGYLELTWPKGVLASWLIGPDGDKIRFYCSEPDVDLNDPDALSKIRTTLETIQRRWS